MSGIKDAKKKGTQKAQETDSAYPADYCHDTDPDRILFLIRPQSMLL